MKRERSLVIKLFISFMVVIIVSVLVVSASVYNRTLVFFRNEVNRTNQERISLLKNAVEIELESVKKDAINIGRSRFLQNIHSIDTTEIDNSYVMQLDDVFELLRGVKSANDRIHSIYLFDENTDYIYTSEFKAVRADRFEDSDWLAEYKKDKGTLKWLDTRVAKNLSLLAKPIDYGKLPKDAKKVITLIYPLNYISNMNGVIAINILEEKLYDLVSQSNGEDMGYVTIINRNGMVISSPDKAVVCQSMADKEYVGRVMRDPQNKGLLSAEIGQSSHIVTFSKATFNNWIYIGIYPFEKVEAKINSLRNVIILITIILIAFSVVISYIISMKLYNPVKKLVDEIKAQKGINVKENKNEMVFIYNAFNELIRQGNQISNQVEHHKRRNRESYIRSLLSGDVNPGADQSEEIIQFQWDSFLCILLSIDDYNSFVRKYSGEKRHYIKAFVLKIYEDMISENWRCEGTYYEKDKVAFILNIARDEVHTVKAQLGDRLDQIKKEVYKLFDFSVTTAVGDCYEGINNIELSFSEARDAIKYRLIHGYDSLLTAWKLGDKNHNNYYYPAVKEKHIMNYLKLGAMDNLTEAVESYIEEIKAMQLSYDNVIQVLNELLNNTLKYMLDMQMNPSEVFNNSMNLYQSMARLETLDEIRNWLCNIYRSIIEYYKGREENKSKYMPRILEYIEKHYKEDVDGNILAGSVGISYSHLRRIIREELDTSLYDYVNQLRIEEAKKLLKQTDMTINDIALKIGYCNFQSFKRFFKKFEGIAPGEYRKIG